MRNFVCCLFTSAGANGETQEDYDDQIEGERNSTCCTCFVPELCKALAYGLPVSTLFGFFTSNLVKNAANITIADNVPGVDEEGNIVLLSAAFFVYGLLTSAMYFVPVTAMLYLTFRAQTYCIETCCVQAPGESNEQYRTFPAHRGEQRLL